MAEYKRDLSGIIAPPPSINPVFLLAKVASGIIQILVLVSICIIVSACNDDDDSAQTGDSQDSISQGTDPQISGPPSGLALPYAPAELDLDHGSSHPLGIIRFSLDDPNSHPGIDLQPVSGAEILAMADGTIVMVTADSRFAGFSIIRLQVGTTEWAVEYEPLILDGGLAVGSQVTLGQRLGTFDGGFALSPALIHIDLRPYESGDFLGYAGSAECWVDNLTASAKTDLEATWNTAKVKAEFINTWKTSQMEGMYFLRGLLNATAYPDGPMMCYPPGTDVREPAS